MRVNFSFDTNLVTIEKASKLDKLDTSRYYRVYGLIMKDNPPILIEYQTLPDNKTEKDLKSILHRNGLPVEFKHLKYNTDLIEIGLRLDVREHIFLSVAALHNIIGYLENRININTQPLIGLSKILDVEKKLEKTLDFAK